VKADDDLLIEYRFTILPGEAGGGTEAAHPDYAEIWRESPAYFIA
jgi:hypothetical protein